MSVGASLEKNHETTIAARTGGVPAGFWNVPAHSIQAGAWSDQAGVAFIQNSDGSIRLATETRPEERTLPQGENVQLGQPHGEVAKPTKSQSSKGSTPGHVPKGSEKPWLTEFELTERSGKLISSETFKGQPYVVGFFYATCPSICVRQNEKFKILQDKFRGQPIRLVEITCDPEVDRPEVLAEYANRFEADKDQWLFFTATWITFRELVRRCTPSASCAVVIPRSLHWWVRMARSLVTTPGRMQVSGKPCNATWPS